MVNVALPTIMAEFKAPLHLTEWVVLAYLLTISATLLFWGHLADRLGRGRFYGLGFLVFGAGSLFCGLSSTLTGLVLSRFLQALGAALMMANGPAIIRETFPPDKLGRSMGLIGVPVSLGLMCGPVLGGYVIEYLSWRALFFLSLPVSLSLGVLAQFVLPRRHRDRNGAGFDWLGGLLWMTILLAVSYVLTHAASASLSLPRAFAIIVVLVVAAVFFVRIENRVPDPILPLGLLKKRFFCIGVISALLSFLVLFSVLILMPFYLDRVLGLSPSAIGLIMLAIPFSAMLVAPLAGWLSDYVGARILSTLGLAFSTVGLFLLATLSPDTRPLAVAGRLLFFGIGQAAFLSPNSASVLGRLRSGKNTGTAAALLATARNLGMMMGIALAGLFFSFYFRMVTGGMDLGEFRGGFEGEFCLALRYAFLSIAVFGIASVLISWQRPVFQRNGGSDTHIEQ